MCVALSRARRERCRVCFARVRANSFARARSNMFFASRVQIKRAGGCAATVVAFARRVSIVMPGRGDDRCACESFA